MSDFLDSDKSDVEVITKQVERNRELVDLTQEQVQQGAGDVGALDEMDDFDLLDATIDPTDVKSMLRVHQLKEEIQYEKSFIACKMAFKFSQRADDPWNLME